MARRRKGHLYRNGAASRERRAFEGEYEARGYSKARADRIYGATVGKVRRERAAKRAASVSSYAHSHRHSRGDHKGACPAGCRAGRVAHRHRTRRGRRARRRY